jgi:hypothetical protein
MRAIGFMHVVGYATAVALAIGGTATALPGTNTVDSGDIIDGQVKTSDLAGSSVKSGKVLNNSLKGLDVKDGSLTGTEITDNSLTGADVLESSLDLSTAGCQVGTILGAARIDGYNAPAMFGTGAWVTFPRNCSGGSIEVRRNGVGSYNVRFNGISAEHVQVTVEQGAVAHSIITAYKEVVSNTATWRVSISDDTGTPEDRFFQIMTY